MERPLLMFFALLSSFVLAWLPVPTGPDVVPAFREIGKRLNREKRSETDRAVRGVLLTILVAIAGFVLGRFVERLLGDLGDFGGLVGMLGLGIVLAAPKRHALLRRYLGGSLLRHPAMASKAAAMLAHQKDLPADEHAAARLVVAEMARDVERRLVSSVFWFALGGYPALFMVWAVLLLDVAVGRNETFWRPFGITASNLDTALRFIPARLSVLLIACGAVFVDQGKPRAALTVAMRDAQQHPSRLGGWPVAAMAGALGIMLGTPKAGGNGWIGDGSARIGWHDVNRTMRLYGVLRLILAGLCAVTLLVV